MKTAMRSLFWLVFLVPSLAIATETASSVRGVVVDQQGNPVSVARITVRNDATGLTRSSQSNGAGKFTVRNLQVADTYSVSAALGSKKSEVLSNVSVSLGGATDLTLVLLGSGAMEEVVVTATRSPVPGTGRRAARGAL